MRTSIYLALMAASAAMSLLRGFVVAGLLEPGEFTTYAVVVALGTFLSNLLSFGLIEGTVKQFPRIAVAGGASTLLALSDAAARKLAQRAVFGLPLFALAAYFGVPGHPLIFIALAAVAFSVALLGLLASVQRALLHVLNLALANGLRAFLYLLLAALGAYFFGLRGAIAGEVVAAMAGALASREIFKLTLRERAQTDAPTAQESMPNVPAQAGVTLFLAYSALAVPVYLDRAYVTAVFSAADSAAYAVLALFATGATVFVNIVAQKVGPELIARDKAGATLRTLLLMAGRWSAATIVIWVMVIALVAWGAHSGYFSFLEKYALTTPLFFAIMLLGCAQVASLFEFVFVARDQEHWLLFLTLGYLLAVCGLAGTVAVSGVSLVRFIHLFALVKFIYLAALLVALCASRGTRKGKSA